MTMEVGGWVQVSLINKLEILHKNSPILALIFCGSIPCIFCLYIHLWMLVKVVNYYGWTKLIYGDVG